MSRLFYWKKHYLNVCIFILFTILIPSILKSQTKKVKKFFVVPTAAYTWQGTHNIDAGFNLMLLLDAKNNHSNIGVLITGNLMRLNRSTYLTPSTKLRIMPHTRKKLLHLAWFASIGHSYTTIHQKTDQRVTPELGVKWEQYNLSLGYNFPLSGYQDGYTKLLRIVFTYHLF